MHTETWYALEYQNNDKPLNDEDWYESPQYATDTIEAAKKQLAHVRGRQLDFVYRIVKKTLTTEPIGE
jgi:hypothetical protein